MLTKRSLAVLALSVLAAAPVRAEEKLTGDAILAHPIGTVAVEYAALVKADKMEEAVKLSSKEAQKRRKARSAQDRKESDAFMKDFVPDALSAAITAGGILLLDGDKATLNVVTSEHKTTPDGTVSMSSSTMALPFVREDGQWRVAQ
jgi:hypothetical protein